MAVNRTRSEITEAVEAFLARLVDILARKLPRDAVEAAVFNAAGDADTDTCTHVFWKGKSSGSRCQGKVTRPETKCSKHKKRVSADSSADDDTAYASALDGSVARVDEEDELHFTDDRPRF